MSKSLCKRGREITEASIIQTQASVERAIAEAFQPDEVLRAYDMAAACRLLSRQCHATKSVQNKSAALHTKAVRKVGEVTQRLREEGVLAKNGGRRISVDSIDSDDAVSTNSTLTLAELGISRDIAAAGVKLLAASDADIDAMAEAATLECRDFSCKRALEELRPEPVKKPEQPPHEEMAAAVKNAVTKFVGRLTTPVQFAYVRQRLESLLDFLSEQEAEHGSRRPRKATAEKRAG